MRLQSPIVNSLASFVSDIWTKHYVDLSRVYLSHFTDWAKHDVRCATLGQLYFPTRPDTPSHSESKLFLPVKLAEHPRSVRVPFKPNIQDQIYLRRRLVRFEHMQPFPFNLIFVIRRAISPLEIKGTASFICAMGWLLLYTVWVYIFGLPMQHLCRRPKELMNIKELPDIRSPEPRGLVLSIKKWRKGELPGVPLPASQFKSTPAPQAAQREDESVLAPKLDAIQESNTSLNLLETKPMPKGREALANGS